MIYNGFQWKHWRKIMGKTFEEWFKEVNNLGELEDRVYVIGNWSDEDYFSYSEFEEVLRETWEASRQNMATKDI